MDISNISVEPNEPLLVELKPNARKRKQTFMSDYFTNKVTEYTFDYEIEANTSADSSNKNTFGKDEQSSSVGSKNSRYGRAIKPKNFEVDSINNPNSPDNVNSEPTEVSLNESNMEISIRNELSESESFLVTAPPPKKRGRPKRSEIFADVNVNEPSDNQHEIRDTYKVPEPELVISKRRIRMPSKLIAYEIEENRRKERRKQKSEQRVVNEPITINELVDISILLSDGADKLELIEPIATVAVKRRGRPKKSIVEQPIVVSEQFETIETKDSIAKIKEGRKSHALDESKTDIEVPKRRGRRSNRIEIAEQYDEIEETELNDIADVTMNDTLMEELIEESQKEEDVPKRSGRPKKIVKIEEGEQLEVNNSRGAAAPTSDNTPKRRGRPRLNPESNMNTTLDKNNSYECGNCKELVLRSKWKPHTLIHYGATWRESVDEPIDLDDQNLVARIMTKFIKYNKVQYMRCAKCYDKKRSVVGYLSHIEICGLAPEEVTALKAECEFCHKLYRKVSLLTHTQSFCPVRRKQIEAEKQNEPQPTEQANTDAGNNEELTESGRPKRTIKKTKHKVLTRSIEDYIKVGVKVTGGVYKAWLNQLNEEKRIKCSYQNCTFVTCDLEEMRNHFSECRGKMVQCKLCLYATQSRDDVFQHIEQKHADAFNVEESDEDPYYSDGDEYKADSQSSSDDYDDGDDGGVDENGIKRYKRRRQSKKRRKKTVPLPRVMAEDSPAYWAMIEEFYSKICERSSLYSELAYQWTNDFVCSHYDQKSLVIDRHVQNAIKFMCLKKSEASLYIKSLLPKSTEFVCQKQFEYHLHPKSRTEITDWMTLELFKSINTTHIKSESSVLFCGGGIVALEWIPLPLNYDGCQILAICTRNSPANHINATNKPAISEISKYLVQLWSVSTKTPNEIEKVEFLYGIAHDDGPIYTMAFCPSDAYNADQRLALLALPDCYGNINIVSLPEKVSKLTKDNAPNFIRLEPIIKLQTKFNDKKVFQTVTKMTWLRTKGHSTLCAGYNTGLVGIWNFEHLSSTYLCKRTTPNNVTILLPKRTFMGSLHCIMQLDLHADLDNQPRWLLVGGLDRKTRLYDLNDSTLTPVISPIYRSRILTGAWPLHWPIYFSIIDAAITRIGGGVHIKQILNTNNLAQSTNLLNEGYPSNLSFSDWLNAGIYGNDTGDVFLVKFQQLMVHDRFDSSNQLRVLSSSNTIIEDNETIVAEPNDEENSNLRKNAKLIFLDSDTSIKAPKLATRVTPIHQYPYAKVNQAAINPNKNHHKMYAIGYEAGFCRIQFLP